MTAMLEASVGVNQPTVKPERMMIGVIRARMEPLNSLQSALASISDRSQDVVGSRYRIQRERIQQKYTLANAIYTDMAKQLEQARMQVKRDTPVLTVIQPVTVPSKPSNSRAKTLIVWTFLGFVLGCGIVLAKGYWPKLKEQLAGNPETGN